MGQQRLDKLRIGGGARYTGTIRTTASVYDGKIRPPPWWMHISYEVDSHWQVQAKAKNLFAKKHLYCNTT
ncbi:TonB-dependent receptor [Pseudomonas sp.]|uniref:TonB-dependent receptor n=1 Tax=Pseudomonas sp. TaxID=306 RepID=UPI00258FD0D8|nr:TonB-dependent receptor [Pseudomonas sp.]